MGRYRFVVGSLIVLGCSGQSIDVGDRGGQNSTAVDGLSDLRPSDCTDPTPLPSWPSPSDCVATSDLPQLLGTWQGYVENQQAPWDNMVLEIKGASVAGGVCGTLSIGSGTLPPATDPKLGYPNSSEPQYGIGGPGAPYLSGYKLTILNGTTDGTRVRFSVGQTEPYRDWCALQRTFSPQDTNRGCNCLPPFGSAQCHLSSVASVCTVTDLASSAELKIDEVKMQLCNHDVCACNASGCTANLSGNTTDFDLRFTGDRAVGSNTGFSAHPTDFVLVNN